jgi:hypothetical protein
MEYFYGGGGRSNPDFTYRFLVKDVTSEMHHWCDSYPLNGPFERWHIRANTHQSGKPIVQIESRKAAYMFRIAFSEYIIEDMTYSFAKDDTWTV